MEGSGIHHSLVKHELIPLDFRFCQKSLVPIISHDLVGIPHGDVSGSTAGAELPSSRCRDAQQNSIVPAL